MQPEDLLDPLATKLDLLTCSEVGAVRAAALFGSRAKGTATSESDADVLLLTDGGPECSRIVLLDGLEVHVSYLPADRLSERIPAKWWEPLSTARLIERGPDRVLVDALERARELWLDPKARQAQAQESAETLKQKLDVLRESDAQYLPRLRQLADGAMSVACFRAGEAEPSKRRRASGLARALARTSARSALEPYVALCVRSLPEMELTGLRLAAREAFPSYCRWILAHERDPLLRSLPGGVNRWWIDTERPAREGAMADVMSYLGFVLDRLWLDTAGPREILDGEPWFRELVDRVRPNVEPNTARALCRTVFAQTLSSQGLA